ncbi:hypothetical protein HanIR_Chr12g0577331 [Helianthus annuus]|nr:hypothetical protein HanIR_Chr12g0577331 [Helianthus annuus]
MLFLLDLLFSFMHTYVVSLVIIQFYAHLKMVAADVEYKCLVGVALTWGWWKP